ncbi:MAG TPA: hypothetical protein DCM27_02755 [Rhodospirillaceae bacterium]|nr:hypothetical protein [Rhodospirillaceae bacterium]
MTMKTHLFIALSLLSVPALAADEKSPLEITADKALEWNQTDKTYIARGKAVATQGTLTVKADLLTAHYAGKDGNSSDITLLTADGNVTLSTATDVATGDKVVYDLITGQAVLSGTRPKIVKDGKDTLEADKISVWTKNNLLDHAEADGNVVIVNGEQKATGNKATYNATTNLAELIGQVKVTQGPNLLEGDKAEVDLTNHVSKMTSAGSSQRVKGVFFTHSQQKN